MAYSFASASSQYLSTASAPASVYPMTLAMWYRPSTVTDNSRILTVSASNGHRHQLVYNPQFNQTQAVTVGVSAQAAVGSFSYAVNTWYHHAGVFASATDRSVWVNGTQGGTNTTSPGTVNAFDRVTIGAGGIPVGLYFSGNIAEVGVWNVALTAAEIASLADGIACDHIRPESLVFYAPLVRDLIDKVGGLTITNNGTATVADHPRIYY